MLSDFHMHSTFSDGRNSQEEMVLSALEKGLTRMGFSEHGYAPYDGDCCLRPYHIAKYRRDTAKLREKYAGRIGIYCGIEQDIFSHSPTDKFDYVIGSVHYLRCGGKYMSVDHMPEKTELIINSAFGGDALAFAEEYFATVGTVAEKTGCDIVGHFDLLTKFNEKQPLIDTSSGRYIAAWHRAVDRIMQRCTVFEINTGAISRGWRTSPYPALDICRYIQSNHGTFILSSDSHSAENIAFEFDRYEKLFRDEGIEISEFSI